MADVASPTDTSAYSQLDAIVNDTAPLPPGGVKPSAPTTLDGVVNDPVQPSQLPKMADNGQSVEPRSGWRDGLNALGNHLAIGGGSLTAAAAGLAGIADENMTPEDMQKRVETDSLIKAQTDSQNWDDTHGNNQMVLAFRNLPWNGGDPSVKGGFHTYDPANWLVEQVPGVGVNIAASLIGAGITSFVGAPMVGAVIGPAVATYFMTAGNHYYDMRKMGVNRDNAMAAAGITAAGAATVTAASGALASKMLPDIAQTVFKSGGFRKSLGILVPRYLKAAGINESAVVAQQAADAYADYLALTAKGNEPGVTFNMKQAQDKFFQGLVQGTVVGGAMELGLGSLSAHSGMKAIKVHSERMIAQILAEQLEQVRIANGVATKDAQAAKVETEVQGRVVQKNAASRKRIGFLDVNTRNTDVAAAEASYEQEKQNLKNSPNDQQAKLAVAQAKAELDHARYAAKVQAFEEAATHPNLTEEFTLRKREIKQRIADYEDDLDQAQTPGEKVHWEGAIKKAKAQLKETEDFLALGGEDKIKANVEAMKLKVQKQADAARVQVALAALEKRMNNRDQTINTLRGWVRDVKKQNKLAEEGASLVDGIAERKEKIAKLREEQEVDQLYKDLLLSGGLTDTELLDIAPEVPTKKLQGLVKIAKTMIDRAAKSGVTNTKQLIRAASKLLYDIVEKSRIPKEDKTRLQAKIKILKLDDALETFNEVKLAIDKAFNDAQEASTKAELNRQLGRISDEMGTTTTLPGVIEKLLVLKQWAANYNLVHEFLLEFYMSGRLPSMLDQAKLQLATLFPRAVKDMNHQEMMAIIEQINDWIEHGKAEATVRSDEKAARQAENERVFFDRATPDAHGKGRLKSKFDKVRKSVDNWIQSAITDPSAIFESATQFGKTMSTMADRFNLTRAFSNYHNAHLDWNLRFGELVRGAGLKLGGGFTKQEWAKFMIQTNKEADILYYDYLEEPPPGQQGPAILRRLALFEGEEPVAGEPGTARGMTLGQLLQAWLHLADKDPDAMSRLKYGNKFSRKGEVAFGESTQEVIEDHLDANLPGWRVAATALQQYYSEFHKVVDELAWQRYGRRIEKNETYGGELLSSADPSAQDREIFRRSYIKAGSTLARQGGRAKVRIVDALRSRENHTAHNTRELHLLQVTEDLQAFVASDKVKSFITNVVGERTFKALQGFSDSLVVGQRRAYNQMDAIFSFIRANIYTRFLSLRPEQFAKQLTGALHVFQVIGLEAAIEGWQYQLSNPEEANALMNKSGIYRQRMTNGMRDRDFHSKPVPGTLKGDLHEFNNKFMGPVNTGDHTAVNAGFPVLLDAIRKGKTVEEAVDVFSDWIDNTQSSGSEHKAAAIFGGGSLQKMLTIMSREPTSQVALLTHEARVLARATTAAEKAAALGHLMRVAAISYSAAYAYNLIGWAITTIPPFATDEQRDEKFSRINDQSVLGPYGGVVIAGGMLSALSVMAGNVVKDEKTRAFDPSLISADPVSDMGRAMAAGFRAQQDPTPAKVWKFILAGSNVAGDVTGVPITTVLKDLEPFIGVRE